MNPDKDDMFQIGADGINASELTKQIQQRVAEKLERGVYTDARVARAERMNLAHIRDNDNFLPFYLDCLRDAVFVDISDFEITERRRFFSAPLVTLKKAIWKLLKFYTYRLWAQQNQVNGLLLSAVEGVDNRTRDKIAALEKRVAELENASSSD